MAGAHFCGVNIRARKIVRRILWNFYAWPLTLVLIAAEAFSLANNYAPVRILDLAISLPALVVLHLHIWDKRLLSAKFWKPYAFFYILWDFVFNIILEPLTRGRQFDASDLIGGFILIPFYVGVFRYAFRKWNEVII
jgi:hypothetical protein